MALSRFLELMIDPYQAIWSSIPSAGGRQLGWRHYVEALVLEPAVLPEHCPEAVVGKGGNPKIIGASHCRGGQQRVDDRLLGGLNGRFVDRIDPLVLTTFGPERRRSVAGSRVGVVEKARNRSPEPAAGYPTHAADPESCPARYPPELMGKQRCVGRDDDDDRAVLPLGRAPAGQRMLRLSAVSSGPSCRSKASAR